MRLGSCCVDIGYSNEGEELISDPRRCSDAPYPQAAVRNNEISRLRKAPFVALFAFYANDFRSR